MHNKINISDKIYWVGCNDRRTQLFENYWPLPKGVAYNSYVIVDEKIAIIDTVEKGTMDEYLDNIQKGYFDFIRQQTNMRILVLDTNNLDFVQNQSDYQLILDVISRDHPVGIQRISF